MLTECLLQPTLLSVARVNQEPHTIKCCLAHCGSMLVREDFVDMQEESLDTAAGKKRSLQPSSIEEVSSLSKL